MSRTSPRYRERVTTPTSAPTAAGAATSSRADEQRRRVLALAAEIFSRRGFRATSMNEIAAAVGLSKPTLYHYFRSKEELLVRIYSDVLDESLTSARRTVAAAPGPLEAIRDLIASRVAYTCRNQALLKVCSFYIVGAQRDRFTVGRLGLRRPPRPGQELRAHRVQSVVGRQLCH